MAKPFCALLVPPSGHLMVRAIAEAVFFAFHGVFPLKELTVVRRANCKPHETRARVVVKTCTSTLTHTLAVSATTPVAMTTFLGRRELVELLSVTGRHARRERCK